LIFRNQSLSLNHRVPGSSPGAPTKQKSFGFSQLGGGSPRTKRLSCDAFCGRSSHGLRRVDNVL
jgi:hypothetical protein